MKRCLTLGGLALAGFMLSACAGGHSVDRAELRPSQTAAANTPARRVARAPLPRRELWRAQRPERSRIAGPPDAVYARDTSETVETTGSTGGRATQHRPMPFVGTPEWQQLQAEEAERERRIQRAMQNICRGC